MHDTIAEKIVRTLTRAAIAAIVLVAPASRAATLPDPALDPASTTATAVLAGGCFWGMQAVFKHVKGVTRVTAGYSGGSREDAHYQTVGSGATGHAESVQIEYDPTQISFGQVLKVFFAVAHDPTQLNRQGPDVGTEYRSAIFFATPEQQRVAQGYIAQLQESKVFTRPIVTEVAPLTGFYPAEAYHQDYAELHPDSPYIIINDLPKIANLQKQFAALYVAK